MARAERRITELRRCGELRHAERYGWLSLAAWLLGMSVSVIAQTRPDVDGHRAPGWTAATCWPTLWARTRPRAHHGRRAPTST